MRTARLRAVHPVLWAGWAALAAGAVLCVIGWYGMSGERFAERQLPYLASCTVPGAALIVAGAVLLTHGRNALAAARVEELYELLVTTQPGSFGEAERPAVAPLATSGDLRMIPGGTLFHRADCPLVTGKPNAVPVDAHVLRSGELGPCPICEPEVGTPEPRGKEGEVPGTAEREAGAQEADGPAAGGPGAGGRGGGNAAGADPGAGDVPSAGGDAQGAHGADGASEPEGRGGAAAPGRGGSPGTGQPTRDHGSDESGGGATGDAGSAGSAGSGRRDGSGVE